MHRIWSHVFNLSCVVSLTCCYSEKSPYEINEIDKATIATVANFENFQMRATELTENLGGSAEFIVDRYDWDHENILYQLERIAHNNDLDLPSSLTDTHKSIIDQLSRSDTHTFDELYLLRMNDELVKTINSLHLEQDHGAEFSVLALSARLVPVMERQKNAIDSVLLAN